MDDHVQPGAVHSRAARRALTRSRFRRVRLCPDDWTAADASQAGEPSPRDNVVFEAELFAARSASDAHSSCTLEFRPRPGGARPSGGVPDKHLSSWRLLQ
jgi:hypothetical protein